LQQSSLIILLSSKFMVLVVVAPRVILFFERLHGSSLSLPAYERGSVDTTALLKITNSLTSLFTIFLFSNGYKQSAKLVCSFKLANYIQRAT